MGAAADRLLRGGATGERIAVFADYDVDGGASAALLLTWLRAHGPSGHALHPRPDRRRLWPERPGHGGAWRATHDLILCVDCGTLSP